MDEYRRESALALLKEAKRRIEDVRDEVEDVLRDPLVNDLGYAIEGIDEVIGLVEEYGE